MTRLDLTKQLQVGMMYCPACKAFVHVGVANQQFVYHCATCKLQYDYADCRQVSVTLQPNPTDKGGTHHEERTYERKHP